MSGSDLLQFLFGGIGLTFLAFMWKLFTQIKPNKLTLEDVKSEVPIVFIDDDSSFKVSEILRNSGWSQTRLIGDPLTLEISEIKSAEIICVDIHGIGKNLRFSDEGLGLALALKDKYPEKKIVIYSAVQSGDRFHEALRRVDDTIPKNADSYQFELTIERLVKELYGKRIV